MGFESISAFIESAGVFGDFFGDDAYTSRIIQLGLTVAFFMFAVVFCGIALRSAYAARRAHEEATDMLRSVQSYAVEVRQLAAQTERASLRAHNAGEEMSEGLSERINAVRFGEANADGETVADVEDETVENNESSVDAEGHAQAPEPENGETQSFAADVDSNEDASERLADATRAASEPRSLLSGMLRRR